MAQRAGVFFKGTLSKKSPHSARGFQDRFFTIDHRSKQLLYYLSEDHFNTGLAEKGSLQLDFIDKIELKDAEFIIDYSPPPPPPSSTSTAPPTTPPGEGVYHIRAQTGLIAEQWAIKFLQTKDFLALKTKISVPPAVEKAATNQATPSVTGMEQSSPSFAMLHAASPPPPPPSSSSSLTVPAGSSTPGPTFTSPRSLQASQQQQSRDQSKLSSQKSSLGAFSLHTAPRQFVTSGSYTQGSTNPPTSGAQNQESGSSSFDIDDSFGRSVSNLADFAQDSLGMKLLQIELGVAQPERQDANKPVRYGTVQKQRPSKGLFSSFSQYQSRYLVLTHMALSYYESEGAFQKNPKGAKSVLHTHLLSDVRRVDDKKEYKFQVTHNPGNGEQPRIYVFKVAEEYTLNEWIQAISKIIHSYNDGIVNSKSPLNTSNAAFATPTLRANQPTVLNSPAQSSMSQSASQQFLTGTSGKNEGPSSARATSADPSSTQLNPLLLSPALTTGSNAPISQLGGGNQQLNQPLGEDDIRYHGWLMKREKDGKFFQGKKTRFYYVLTGKTFSSYESIPPTVTHPHLQHTIQLEPIEEIHFNTIRNANSAKSASGKTKDKIKDKNIDLLFVVNTNHEALVYSADTPGEAEAWVNAFLRANTERLRNQHNTASIIAGKMNKMLTTKGDANSTRLDEQHQTNTGERFREVDQLTFSLTAQYNRQTNPTAVPLTQKGGRGAQTLTELHHQHIQTLIQDTKSLLEMGMAKNIESKNEHPNWFAVMYVYTAEQATPIDITKYRTRLAQNHKKKEKDEKNEEKDESGKRPSAVPGKTPKKQSHTGNNNNDDDDDDDDHLTPAQGSIVAFDSSLHTNPAFSHFRTLYPVAPYSATPTGLGVGMYSEGGSHKGGNEPALQQALAQRSLSIGRVSGELCNIDGLYVEYWREVSRTEIRRPVYFEDLELPLQTSAIQYATPLFSTFSTSTSLITTPTIIPSSVNIQTGLITTMANHTNSHQPGGMGGAQNQHLSNPGMPNQLTSTAPIGQTNPLATAIASSDPILAPSYALQLLNKELSQNPYSIQAIAGQIFDDSDRRGVLFESNSSFITMNCLQIQPPFIPLTTSSSQMVSLQPQHDAFVQAVMKQQLAQLLENGQKYISRPQHLTLPTIPVSTISPNSLQAPYSPANSSPGPDSAVVVNEVLGQNGSPLPTTVPNPVTGALPPLHIPLNQLGRLYKDANMDIPLQFQTIPMSLLKQANNHAFAPKVVSNDHYTPFDPTIAPITTASAQHFVESSYYANTTSIPALVASASSINNVNWQLGPAQLSPYTLLGPKANRFSSLLTLFVPSKSAAQHHINRVNAANAKRAKDEKIRATGVEEFVEILSTLSSFLDSRALRLSKYYDRHSAQAYQQWIDIKFAAQQLLKYIRSKQEMAKNPQSAGQTPHSPFGTGSLNPFGPSNAMNNLDETFTQSSSHSQGSVITTTTNSVEDFYTQHAQNTRQRSSVLVTPPPPPQSTAAGYSAFGGLGPVNEDHTNRDGTCMVEEMVLLDTLPIQRRSSRAPSVLVTPFISSTMGLRKGHVSNLTKKWETTNTQQQPQQQQTQYSPTQSSPLPKALTTTQSQQQSQQQTGIIAQPRESAAPTSFISDDYDTVKALTRMHLERKLQRTSVSGGSSPLDNNTRRQTRVFQSRTSRADHNLTSINEKSSGSSTVEIQTGELSMAELDRQMKNMSTTNESDVVVPGVEMPIAIDEGNEDEDYEDDLDPNSNGPISGGLSCIPQPLLPGSCSPCDGNDDGQFDGEDDGDDGDDDDDDDEDDDGMDELELYDGWRFGSDPLLDRTLVKVCVYQTDAQDLYQSDLKNQRQVAEMTCTIGEILRNPQGNLSREVDFHFERDKIQSTYPGTITVSFQHCLRTRIANTGRYTHGNFITRGSEYVPVTIDNSMDKMFNVDAQNLLTHIPTPHSHIANPSSSSWASSSMSSVGLQTALQPSSQPSNPPLSPRSQSSVASSIPDPPPGGGEDQLIQDEPQFWRPVQHMLPPFPTMQSYAVAAGQHLRTQEYDILCLESMQTSPHTFSVPAQVVKHAKIQRAKELQILREINDCLLLELRTLEEFQKTVKEDIKEFKKNGPHALPPGAVILAPPSQTTGEYDLFTALQYPQLVTRAQNIIRRIVDKELAISSFLPNSSLSSLEPFILTHSLIVAHNIYANPAAHLNFTGLPGSEAALAADQSQPTAKDDSKNQAMQQNQPPSITRESSYSVSDVSSRINSQQVLSLRNNLYSFHAHRLAAILGDKNLLSKRIELIPTLQKQLKAKIAEYEKLIDFYGHVETILDSYRGQYDDLFFKPSTTKVDELLDFVGTNMHSQVIQFVKLPVNRPQLPLYNPPTELIPDLLAPAAQPLLHSSLLSHINQTYFYNHMMIQNQSLHQPPSTPTPLFSRSSAVFLPPLNTNDQHLQLYNLLPALLPNTLPTTLQEFVSYKLPYTYSDHLLRAVSSTLHAHGLLSFLLSPHQQSESFSPFHAHTKGLLGYVPIKVQMNGNGTNVSLSMDDYGSNPTINGNWRYPAISHLVSTTAGALASHTDYAQFSGYYVEQFSKRIPQLKSQLLALTKGIKEIHMKQQSDAETSTGDMSLQHDILGKKVTPLDKNVAIFVNSVATANTTLSDYHLLPPDREIGRDSLPIGRETALLTSLANLPSQTPTNSVSITPTPQMVAAVNHATFQKLYVNTNFINRVVQQSRQMNALSTLIQHLEGFLFKFEQRKVPLVSQALTALATTFCSALVYHSPTQLLDVVNCGFLFPLQSYVTAHQDEFAMLSDFEYASQALSHVKIRLVCKDMSSQGLEAYSARHQDSIITLKTPTSPSGSSTQPTALSAGQFMLSPSKASSGGGSTGTGTSSGLVRGNIFFNSSTAASQPPGGLGNLSNASSQTAPYCPDLNGFGIVSPVGSFPTITMGNTGSAVMDVATSTGTLAIPPLLQGSYDHFMNQLQNVYQDYSAPDLSTPSLLYTLLTKYQGNLAFLGQDDEKHGGDKAGNVSPTNSNKAVTKDTAPLDDDEKAIQTVWNSLSYAARNLLNSQAVYQNSRQIKANQWLSSMSISFSSSNAFDVTKFLATPHSQNGIASRADVFDNAIISSFVSPLAGLGYARLTPKFVPEHMKPILTKRNRFFSNLDLFGSRALTRSAFTNHSRNGSSTPLVRHVRSPSDFLTKPFGLNSPSNSPSETGSNNSSATGTKLQIQIDLDGEVAPPPLSTASPSEAPHHDDLDDHDLTSSVCDGCGFDSLACICSTLPPPPEASCSELDEILKPLAPLIDLSSDEEKEIDSPTVVSTTSNRDLICHSIDENPPPSLDGVKSNNQASPMNQPVAPTLSLSTSSSNLPPPPPQSDSSSLAPTTTATATIATTIAPATALAEINTASTPPMTITTTPTLTASTPGSNMKSLFKNQATNSNSKLASLAGVSTTKSNVARGVTNITSATLVDDTTFRSEDPYTIMTIHLPPDLFYSLPPEVTGLPTATATASNMTQTNTDAIATQLVSPSPEITPRLAPSTPRGTKDLFRAASVNTAPQPSSTTGNTAGSPLLGSNTGANGSQSPPALAHQTEVLIPVVSLLFTQGVNEFTGSLVQSSVATQAPKRQLEFNKRSGDVLIKYAMNYIQLLRYKPIFDRILWAQAHVECNCSNLTPNTSTTGSNGPTSSTASLIGLGGASGNANTTASSTSNTANNYKDEIQYWMHASCGRSDCQRSQIAQKFLNEQQAMKDSATAAAQAGAIGATAQDSFKPLPLQGIVSQLKHQTIEYGLDSPISIDTLCNSSISSNTCYHCLKAMIDTFSSIKLHKCSNNIQQHLSTFQYTSTNAVNIYNQPVDAPPRSTSCGQVCSPSQPCPCLCSCHAFDICLCTPTSQCLSCSFAQICATNDAKICYIIQLVIQLQDAFKVPTNFRNLTIQTLATQLSRTMNGGEMLSCKSAKDRTSMASTWQTIRQLHAMGVPQHQALQMLDHLRAIGVRRGNVVKNTGKTNYAFSSLQRPFLPDVLKPHSSTCSGKKNVS